MIDIVDVSLYNFEGQPFREISGGQPEQRRTPSGVSCENYARFTARYNTAGSIPGIHGGNGMTGTQFQALAADSANTLWKYLDEEGKGISAIDVREIRRVQEGLVDLVLSTPLIYLGPV